jgi:hypothetical protein
MENTPGLKNKMQVPEEIKKWNWAAFWLNWIWGIGNNVYLALICLIPFVSLIAPFYFGVKGNELAWKNKKWESVEEFKRIQKKWAKWAWVVIVGFLILFGSIFFGVSGSMKSSPPYSLSWEATIINKDVQEAFGEPLEKGWLVTGGIQTLGDIGNANLSYSIKGPKGKGGVIVEAQKKMGIWKIENLSVDRGQSQKIFIIKEGIEQQK